MEEGGSVRQGKPYLRVEGPLCGCPVYLLLFQKPESDSLPRRLPLRWWLAAELGLPPEDQPPHLRCRALEALADLVIGGKGGKPHSGRQLMIAQDYHSV